MPAKKAAAPAAAAAPKTTAATTTTTTTTPTPTPTPTPATTTTKKTTTKKSSSSKSAAPAAKADAKAAPAASTKASSSGAAKKTTTKKTTTTTTTTPTPMTPTPAAVSTSAAVAKAFAEIAAGELKHEMKDMRITTVKEVPVNGAKSGVVVSVPYRQLKDFNRMQARLQRELEKKFAGKQFVFVAERTILPVQGKHDKKKQQKRPFSRTLTSVHDAILEDLVYPTTITGRRTRHAADGRVTQKVFLDTQDKANQESRLDTFSAIYKALTGKAASFEFAD